MKAIKLYNILKSYSEKELQEMDIVVEINRDKHNRLGTSEYAELIEEYSSQIRIIHKIK